MRYQRIKWGTFVACIGIMFLVAGAARACHKYENPKAPHPDVNYPQTPLKGTDATYEPDENMGSTPKLGGECIKLGQERMDSQNNWLVCRDSGTNQGQVWQLRNG